VHLRRGNDQAAGYLAQDAGIPDTSEVPAPPAEARVDALSDVLRTIRLSGGAFLQAEFTAPWCISSSLEPQDCAPFLLEPKEIILYHFVVEGSLLVQVPGTAAVTAAAGQVIILPRNEEHRLGSPSA
jgi:Cupin